MKNKAEFRWYGFIYFTGLLWTVYLCFNSPGVLLHDELGHFLISRNAWNYPQLMLDLWGRCVNTILYMLPSLGGLTGARIFSIVLAGLTVLLTTEVARKSGVKRLYLIPFFLWFQPWFNNLSYSAMTEVPFSFFMILGVYLWLKEKENLAGFIFGLLPLVRHEGIVLVGIWCLYMFYRKKWMAGVSAILPLVIYNFIYRSLLGSWPFEIFLDAKPTTLYGSGSWFHFFPRVVIKVGFPLSILSLFAIKPLWRRKEKVYYMAGYVCYFLTHVIIYRFGLFGSGGYSIFLLPLAPAFAIAAASGAEALLKYLPEKLNRYYTTTSRGMRVKTAIVTLYGLSILVSGMLSRPYSLDETGLAMKETAAWIQTNHPDEQDIVSTHAWFYYFFNLEWTPERIWNNPPKIADLPSGTLVVWDSWYSDRWGLSSGVLFDEKNGWRELKEFGDGLVVVFQKL